MAVAAVAVVAAVAAAVAAVAMPLAVGGEPPVVEVLGGLLRVVVLVGGALQGAVGIPVLLVGAMRAPGSHGAAVGRPRREQGRGVTEEEAATLAEVKKGKGSRLPGKGSRLPGRASNPLAGKRPRVRLKPKRCDGQTPQLLGLAVYRARV